MHAGRRASRLVVLDLQGVHAHGLYPPDWAGAFDIAADGARGKAHPVALVACARKLLIFASTVVARGTPWMERTAEAEWLLRGLHWNLSPELGDAKFRLREIRYHVHGTMQTVSSTLSWVARSLQRK